MLARIEWRKIVKCAVKDVDLSFLNEYYAEAGRRRDILLIYDNARLKTLISYEDFKRIKSEKYLHFYLLFSNNCNVGNDIQNAERIFERFPLWNHLIVELWNQYGKFICRDVTDDVFKKIYDILKKSGVNVYRVRMPQASEVKRCNRADVQCKLSFDSYIQAIERGKLNAPWYIDKITEIEESELKSSSNLYGTTMGEGKRKIYLAGPCIVSGTINPEGERLGEMIYEELKKYGMNYSIEYVQLKIIETTKMTEILEHTIRQNDIVLLIGRFLLDYEIDTIEIFNNYVGDKWLYQDMPIHTSVLGNRLLADFLVRTIIQPISAKSLCSADDMVIYEGEPQFSYNTESKIEQYVDRIRKTRAIDTKANIGAIVMNCNPFTYGHRHLVEYASGQVDFLYVFVVEEDLSAIPFSERLFLVYEGVKDISNVIVVPSGQFIISKDTFKNYFEKETEIHDVNTEEDVYIFARYIAKGLHIIKRFVGQEPVDYVTGEYNRTMKKVLPKYGIELIEIPRKELSDGRVISASAVRKLLLGGTWSELAEYVPETTLEYLKRMKETIIERIDGAKSAAASSGDFSGYIEKQIQEFVDAVCCVDKPMIYSIGEDTRNLIERLSDKVVERFEFCDKAAVEEDIYFCGKRVHPPASLLSEYRDYNVIVTSTRYGGEIYEELLGMGVEPERCIFNRINLFLASSK